MLFDQGSYIRVSPLFFKIAMLFKIDKKIQFNKIMYIRPFLALLMFFYTLSVCSCKEELPVPDDKNPVTNALFKLDSLKQKGSYESDGSYKWNVHFKIISTAIKTDSVEFSIVGPAECPFTIESKAAIVLVQPLKFEFKHLYITIPAQLMLKPDFIKKYTFSIVLKKNKQIVDSKTILLGYPLADHPRLMVSKNEIQELAIRFNHIDFSSVKSTFNSQKAYVTTGVVTSDIPNESIRQKMEALAFEYLIDNASKVESGKQAIQLAINYLTSFGAISTTEVTDYDNLNYTNEMIVGAALVYDWCYPLLTDDDKIKLKNAMISVCKRTEYGLPNSSNIQYLSGHYGELNPTVYLAMGIALYDEDPSFFQFAYNEQVKGFALSRNVWAPSGTHHQGAQYIHVRHSHELLQHFMLSKIGLSPYLPEFNTLTFRAMYGKIPQTTDMDGMPEGDGHNGLVMKNPQIYYLSANLSKNPYLQYFSKQNLSQGLFQAARLFIYHNPTITATNPENSLSLTKYFPSPSGMMIARTKWDLAASGFTSNAMVVLMNMKEYNAQNHTHLDGGHFSIYYKGHLALDAGIYQGSDAANGWGKDNYNNYYSRTIAHNSLLIYDPNEPLPYAGWNTRALARDGGQFFFNRQAWDNSQQMLNAGKSSEILAYDIDNSQSPDYSYMKGDLTKAYNVPSVVGSYPAKVDTVRRSFVFLNLKNDVVPGALIVLDRVVSTNASFKKTWLLHTQNQPVVNGSVITASNTTSGRNGKLSTTVLIPESTNQSIQLVGGTGKEYWVQNKNYGSVTQQDAGQWRVELSPSTPKKADNFLNVIMASDINNTQGINDIEKVYSSDSRYVAVRVQDRIVAQSLSLNTTNKRIDFTLGSTNTTHNVLVTDLMSGTWTVSTPSGNIQRNVTAVNGTVSFTSKGGRFIFTQN